MSLNPMNVSGSRMESNAFRADADQFDDTRCHPPKDSTLGEMLKQSGWGSGFKLPFSNEENKALEKQLDIKQKRALEISSNLEDHEEHLRTLKKHYMRVEYDHVVTQSLLTAKLAEIQSEEKTTAFAERFWSKSKAQKKTDEHKLEEVQQRVHSKLNDVERRTALVKDLLSISEFNEAALAKWKEHSVGTGQDIMYVKFFSKVDEKNQLIYEKKELFLNTKKRELSEIVSNQAQETIRLQQLFSRTKREFVKAHNERQETIKSWTKAVQSLKRRELEMEILGNDYCFARQQLRNLNNEIWEKEKFVESEYRTRQATEHTISQIERDLRDLNQEMSQVQEIYSTLCSEYLNFQAELSTTTGDLSSTHKKIRAHDGNMKRFIQRAAKVEAEVIVLESKLDTISTHMCDSETILEQMQIMLQDQEEACAIARKKKKSYRQYFWERSIEKTEVEDQLKMVFKNIQGTRVNLNNNVMYGQREELLLQRLTGDLFHADLSCTQLHSRISHMTNDQANSAYIANQAKLTVFKERMETVIAEKRLVQREVTHDESVRARLERTILIMIEKEKNLKNVLEDLNIDCPRLQKQLQGISDDLKSKLVFIQLEKVLLKRLQEEINNKQENICDLSQYRYLLEGAVKDRKIEIEAHIAIHQTTIKTARENILKLKSFVFEIMRHISKQKRAFDVVSSLLAVDPSSQGDRGFNSFTASVLQIVQERETLNKEKKAWEDKILEAELELRGLETNLRLIETSNCNFKSSLSPASEDSIEAEKIQKAEAVTQASQFRIKQSSKAILKNRDVITDLHTTNHALRNHINKMSFQCDHKVRMASSLTNVVAVQRDKITRWANLSIKILQEIRSSLSPSRLFLIQHDLKLRCLEEKLEYAILMLEKFVQMFPHTKDIVLAYLMKGSETEDLGARISYTIMKNQAHDNPLQKTFDNSRTETGDNFMDDQYSDAPSRTALTNRVMSGYVQY
ncbi:unnamed protein product [Allacma fusca]|uniref:Coiled-coil domain-containing protein 39 n=1 Tax=Allacma fusca TaxID=39272 RepID=A0A8J2PAU5_9HEXA|nr:unnamed protein product [Allacma fusca]